MRIAHFIPEWPAHSQLWFWREVNCLRQMGLEVTIFSTRRPCAEVRARHAFAEQGEREAVYLWPLGWWTLTWVTLLGFLRRPVGFARCVGLAFGLKLEQKPSWRRVLGVLALLGPACYFAREVRRRGIEHIHCHSVAQSAILCMMVRRLSGVGFSLIVNANLEWWGGAMAQKFADADFTLLITRSMVRQMERDYPQIPRARYALGRVGVDVEKWCPPPGGRPERGDGELRVLSVGRLVASKGHDVLLRAVALLRESGQRVRLRIGGEGPERAALEQLAGQLHLGDVVTFLGGLAEDAYLQQMHEADVFVLASHAEPLGVVYMEAMATEIATVGTDAGGVPEIIGDSKSGLLVPPGDAAALANALARLAGDAAWRRELGRAARKAIVEEFDCRLWAGELYRRLTGGT